MDVILPQPESWHTNNEIFHKHLGLNANLSTRVYAGLQMATFEIVMSTALFYSHRKALGQLTGESPAASSVWAILSKELFALQNIAQKSPREVLSEWVKKLKSETSLVLMTDDNPVTGEVFQNANLGIANELAQKKIFSLMVSHNHWRKGFPALNPYTCLICEVSENKAFAIFGGRLKSPPWVAPLLPPFPDFSGEVKNNMTPFEDQSAVEKFERGLPAPFQRVPLTAAERLYDRTVIFHPLVNGEAIWVALGRPNGIIPLNACYQNRSDLSWWDSRPAPEVVRGGLVLDLPAIEKFGSQLAEAAKKCHLV